MNQIGLVLEGGGMRGVYTAGVLDAFLDHDIEFPYVIGVSSGANNGSNFITKQHSRSKRIFLKWSQDNRFLNFGNFLRDRSYFGMEFLFNQLPNELDPFDYASFYSSDVRFVACASNCDTGGTSYFFNDQICPLKYMNKMLRASSSLPIISPTVLVDDYRHLDGFITDPIPLQKSIDDGNTKNVVILTKPHHEMGNLSLMDRFLKNLTKRLYPKLRDAIENSTHHYNDSLKQVFILHSEGKVFLFRPRIDLLKNRYGKDVSDLEKIYQQGYDDGVHEVDDLKAWMASS